MRIVVFGAGGVGAYFGGRLAESGEDVTLVARGAHLEALRSRGLALESTLGDARLPEVRATDDPADVGPVDAVIFATKTWQLRQAAEASGPLMGPETVAVGLQNGVESADVLASVLGPERVLGGTCRIISFVPAPGAVRHVGADPTVVLGEADGTRSERCERLRATLDRAPGVAAVAADDVRVEIWRKLVFLAPFSGVGAVAGAPVGHCLASAATRALIVAAMEEAAAVARARGVSLPDDAVAVAMDFLEALPPSATSSMQRDLADGRRSELDSLSGAVVRLGRQAGVPTPTHAFLYASLLPRELLARGEPDADA